MKKISFIFLLIMMTFILTACGGIKDTNNEFDKSKNITIYTRDTTSGTRDGFFTGINFKEAIKDNTKLKSTYVQVESNGEIITNLNNDEYGIGYISLSSLNNSNLLGLPFNNIEPTNDNVINGTYTLTRNFNYMIRNDYNDDKVRQIVEAFVAYINTIDGKTTIINNDGIVEIKSTDKTWNDIKDQYPIISEDNSTITINFGGSTSVEKIAKALSAEFSPKAGNFIPDHNHTGSGDAFKRTQGTEKDGANMLHIAFASREFKADEMINEGTFGRICIDAIVVVVNSKNTSLTNVNPEILKNVYSGAVNTWEEIE